MTPIHKFFIAAALLAGLFAALASPSVAQDQDQDMTQAQDMTQDQDMAQAQDQDQGEDIAASCPENTAQTLGDTICDQAGDGTVCTIVKSACAVNRSVLPLGPLPARPDPSPDKPGAEDAQYSPFPAANIAADAMMCSLRWLSGKPHAVEGPNISKTETQITNTPMGDIQFGQHIGVVGFDAANRNIEMYRQARLCAPGIGCIDPVLQVFTVTPQTLGADTALSALTITSQSTAQTIQIQSQAYTVKTPMQTANSIRTTKMETRADIIAPPLNSSDESMAAAAGSDKKISNVYDAKSALGFDYYDPDKYGWRAQIALGNHMPSSRSAPGDQDGTFRPDLGPSAARTEDDLQPTIRVSLDENIIYPNADAAAEHLPKALKDLDIDFSIMVKPETQIAVFGQFNMANTLTRRNDNKQDEPASAFQSQIHMNAVAALSANRSVTTGVDIVVDAGPFTVIDVHPTWAVNMPEITKQTDTIRAGFTVHGAVISAFETLSRTKIPPTKSKAYIQSCLREDPPAENDITLEDTKAPKTVSLPQAAYTPAHAVSRFETPYPVPCNVCIYKSAAQSGLISTVKPEDNQGHWQCDMPAKNGCFDLCMFDPQSGITTFKEAAGPLLKIKDDKKNRTQSGQDVCYLEALIK